MPVGCSICMDSYSSTSDVSRIPCGHIFHTNCITTWVRGGSFNCAHCRRECYSNQFQKIYIQDIENENELDAHEANLQCIELAEKNQQLEKKNKDLTDKIHKELYQAADHGHLDVFKILMDMVEDKNPKDPFGRTLLHEVGKMGHGDIFEMILEEVQDKNPKDNSGLTPFHEAAENGQEEICRIILGQVEDKNPKDSRGKTPLHEAAENKHEEICQMILDEVEDKNPKDQFGETPLHIAAKYEHYEICELILDKVEDKNPKDQYGNTPLHFFAKNSQEVLCNYILDEVDDKNPVDQFGKTPLHFSAKNGLKGDAKNCTTNLKLKQIPLEVTYWYFNGTFFFIIGFLSFW